MRDIHLDRNADPLFGWTEETTREYIESRPLAKGDRMLIVNRQAGLLEYELATVENPALGRQRRVLLDKPAQYGGATFYRNGKNCFSPKGQSRMIPPVDQVVQAIEAAAGRSVFARRV